MEWFEEEVIYEKDDKLKFFVTNRRVIYGSTVYATNYIAKVVKDDGKPRKRWEILITVLGVFVCFLSFKVWALSWELGVVLFFSACMIWAIAHKRSKLPMQKHGITIVFTTKEDDVKLSFSDGTQRDKIFHALSRTLYWDVYDHGSSVK